MLKLALPLLEPSYLSFACRPLLLHRCQPCSWGSTSICVAAELPPPPRGWAVTRFYLVLVTVQEHDGDKTGTKMCTSKPLLFWKSGATFGADSLEGQRPAVPLEMCAKTYLYFLADKRIIGPSVAEIERAGLQRDWVWCSRAFCDLYCCSGVLNLWLHTSLSCCCKSYSGNEMPQDFRSTKLSVLKRQGGFPG